MPDTATEVLKELVESNNELASFRAADGIEEYRRRRNRNLTAWRAARSLLSAGEPQPAPGQQALNAISQKDLLAIATAHDYLGDGAFAADYRVWTFARAVIRAFAPQAGEPQGWQPASEMPTCPLFLVQSSRDDDEALDGIDQFDGMWVVRPSQPMTRERWDRWASRHEVTGWMAITLPAPPTQKEQQG